MATSKFPDELIPEGESKGQHDFDSAWVALEQAVPAADSRRMRGRLNRMIRWEQLRNAGGLFTLGGMITALFIGLLVGRILWLSPTTEVAPELRTASTLQLETQLLRGATLSAQLQAIANMQSADALPPHAVNVLSDILNNQGAGVGLQLAALEALVDHAGQVDVQSALSDVLNKNDSNPMIQARLKGARDEQMPPNGATKT